MRTFGTLFSKIETKSFWGRKIPWTILILLFNYKRNSDLFNYEIVYKTKFSLSSTNILVCGSWSLLSPHQMCFPSRNLPTSWGPNRRSSASDRLWEDEETLRYTFETVLKLRLHESQSVSSPICQTRGIWDPYCHHNTHVAFLPSTATTGELVSETLPEALQGCCTIAATITDAPCS